MIILVGKSCSGKDTVVKELTKMGYNKIVTVLQDHQDQERLMEENIIF